MFSSNKKLLAFTSKNNILLTFLSNPVNMVTLTIISVTNLVLYVTKVILLTLTNRNYRSNIYIYIYIYRCIAHLIINEIP